MEQRAAIRFFPLKGLKTREIRTELESMSRPGALARSTVNKWHKRFQERRTDLMDDLRSERPVTQDLAEAIQSMLTERPFMPWTVLCQRLSINTIPQTQRG
jgi:transposase